VRFNPQTSWEATFQPPKSRRPRWGAGGGSGEEGRRGKRRPKSVRYLEGKIGEGSFSDPPRVCVHETSFGKSGFTPFQWEGDGHNQLRGSSFFLIQIAPYTAIIHLICRIGSSIVYMLLAPQLSAVDGYNSSHLAFCFVY
jgi:hypothetical protein